MKTHKTSTALLITACIFLASNLTLADSHSKPLEKVKLQLKWYHQFNFAGYYAAAEKGFYKEAGLDVMIKEGRPGMDFIDEVVSERAEFGVEMPELLIARHNQKPVVVLAAIFQHSPQVILARADAGIQSPQDLIGRKVMWRFDSAAELRAMLINEGVSLEQIEFMELSWDINDLIDGKVDAIHAYVTDQPLALKKAGIESKALSPITYGIDFYGDCLFTSERQIAKHDKRVMAFRDASLKGWEYAMKHPEEIMDVIRDKYKTKNSREYMRHEYERISELMLHKFVEIGHMNPGRWKHIAGTFVNLGMLKPDYSLDGFIYDPNPIPDYTWLIWTAGIITATALLLFVFNTRLRRAVKQRTKEIVLANQNLRANEQQLKAANQQLTANEQQLQASNQQLRANELEREKILKTLETKNNELQSIVYVASHDLKSPIVNINGFGDLLWKSCEEALGIIQNKDISADDKIKKMESLFTNDIYESLEFISSGTRKSQLLLDALLKVSRIGSVEINIQPLDMNRMISDIKSTVEYQLSEKNIDMTIERLPNCLGDSDQINQVFSNLIDNAIKYRHPERKATVNVSAKTENGYCTYCIADNGIGIEQNHQAKVFELFHRLNPDSAEDGEGIGLTIISRILSRHDGHINVESQPGENSKFYVTLPSA